MPEPLSGSVRFSVESLLYYAPKIARTGEELSSAVTTAQRHLLGLGDFFGGSWPDQPFRDSYPRAQYAMLIIAAQLADEIQGIGGGIEQMARTYGIAEDQSTADVARIQQDEGRTNMMLYHTGGLPSPPDTPLNFSGPPAASMVPHPQPNPSPSAAPAPTATTASHVSTTADVIAASPGAHPTPSPQPGADPTAWRPTDGGLTLMGPWPSGDPARMEDAADCWNRLISALDTAWTDLQRYTAYILADAQGPAADAFQDYVDGLTATGHGSLSRAIEAAQDVHDVCVKQAAEVRSLRRTLEETALDLAATFVITQVVSLLTFETTQALGDAIEAGLAARLSSLAEFLAREGTTFARLLDTTFTSFSKAMGEAAASGIQSGLIGGFDLAGSNAVGRAFGDDPVTGTAALKDILLAGAVGTVLGQGSAGGLLGLSAGTASKRLISMGEGLLKTDPENTTAAGLVRLGLQLKSGGITIAAANSAATQLVTQGQVTPVTFFTSAISNRFTTAISPAAGAHRY